MNTKPNTSRFTKTKGNGFAEIKKGIDIACDIITSTLGPHGKNVAIGSKQMPLLARDGATVARSIKLEDAWLRLGSDMLIDAAIKTEHEAGDATTTTCAVVQGILNNIPSGLSKREVCDQLHYISKYIEDVLDRESVSLGKDDINLDLLKRLAITSANNDVELEP